MAHLSLDESGKVVEPSEGRGENGSGCEELNLKITKSELLESGSNEEVNLEEALAVLPLCVNILPHAKIGAIHLKRINCKCNQGIITCAIKMLINKMTVKPWYIAHIE